jgi:hypothetical protein
MSMPVRGFGQKYVDFGGSRSPRCAIERIAEGVVGGSR